MREALCGVAESLVAEFCIGDCGRPFFSCCYQYMFDMLGFNVILALQLSDFRVCHHEHYVGAVELKFGFLVQSMIGPECS